MNTEDKLKLLYETVGEPRCRYYRQRSNPCLKSFKYDYAQHFPQCDGDIMECDFDESRMDKIEADETAWQQRNGRR